MKRLLLVVMIAAAGLVAACTNDTGSSPGTDVETFPPASVPADLPSAAPSLDASAEPSLDLVSPSTIP